MRTFKLLTIFIGVFLFHIQSDAQSVGGIYNILEDYKLQSSEINPNLLIERRTRNQIFMSGGNDYKFFSKDKTLKKRLKKEVWGLEFNDSLFINCFHYKLGLWYAYADRIGDNLFMTAAITMDKEQQQKMAMTSYALGPIGGGISSGKLALKRFYYIIEIETGTVKYLSKDKMLEILSKYPDLVEKYNLEEKPEEIETLKKYLVEFKSVENY